MLRLRPRGNSMAFTPIGFWFNSAACPCNSVKQSKAIGSVQIAGMIILVNRSATLMRFNALCEGRIVTLAALFRPPQKLIRSPNRNCRSSSCALVISEKPSKF